MTKHILIATDLAIALAAPATALASSLGSCGEAWSSPIEDRLHRSISMFVSKSAKGRTKLIEQPDAQQRH